MRSKVFGIDLGTTYSCVAAVDEFGRPAVVNNSDSQPTTPSVVMFDSPNEILVGVQAKRNARVRPDNVVSLVKRHMNDPEWRFRAFDTDYSASAVSSQILRALARDAARSTGEEVKDVVVTVPAYFGDEERKATKLAGELAGLNVLDIINEPTAAAFAYGFAQEGSTNETVLVYDLGGGTFDTTVIRLSDRRIDVIATAGDHELGGVDWDERLASYLSGRFVEEQPAAGDPLDDSYGAQDLITTAEETKQSLSGRESVDAFVIHNGGRASITVTRAEFEELTTSLLERTMELTRQVLDAAAAKGVAGPDRVLLVGGMSKTPAVARRLKEVFGFDAKLTDPDLAVAKGAAIYGQKKELESLVINDLVAQGQLTEGQTLAEAQPADLNRAVEKTAGQVGLSSSAVSELVGTEVSNVTSRGFGVEVARSSTTGDADLYVEFLAHANDTLPISVEQTFFTVSADQQTVRIRVMEQATGLESERIEDNKLVVEGLLEGIPAGQPLGTPVTVTFGMGRDQTIEVTARHSAVAVPLRLRAEMGAASAVMRDDEKAKVDLLKQRT
jgi:molecular chaperone DnaK (HSP70)